MTLASLVLLAALPFASTAIESDPLATYRWTHRLVVIDVPDTEAGRATLEAFRAAIEERMEDVLDRDLLIVPVGDLPRAGRALRPSVDLDAAARVAVRRRLHLPAHDARLALIGKDGGVKSRQSGRLFDLDAIFALIDSMPMRRRENPRR